MVLTEYKIFAVALCALLLYDLVSLAMPRIQGTILNTVVEDDTRDFYYWMKLYIIAAVASGLFGAIQSLCFNIVGL